VIHEEANGDGGKFTKVTDPNEHDNAAANMDDFERLVIESTEVVYEGCGMNRLQASIVLLNMVNLYGIPYTFLDKVLRFLIRDLLLVQLFTTNHL